PALGTGGNGTFTSGTSVAVTPDGIATYKMGPDGQCGSMTFCGDAAAYCGPKYASGTTDNALCTAACGAQQTALTNIVATLGGITDKFAQVDDQYIAFCVNNWDLAQIIVKYNATGQVPKINSGVDYAWMQNYCTDK